MQSVTDRIRTYPCKILTFAGRKTKLLSWAERKLRDDDKLPKFEGGGDGLFAEGCHVVLVRVSDLLDESVGSQSLQRA